MTPTTDSACEPRGTRVEWELRLYVAGQGPRSLAAIANLRRLCREHLGAGCAVEIVDLVEEPHRAKADQIFAVPTLVRRRPPPTRRLIGDLSDERRALAGLEVVPLVEPGGA